MATHTEGREQGQEQRPEADGPLRHGSPQARSTASLDDPEKAEDVHGHPEDTRLTPDGMPEVGLEPTRVGTR